MKKSIVLALTGLFLATMALAQNPFQVLSERPGEKTFKGILSREVIESDTAFKWYAENLKGYTPNALALSSLKKNADSIQLLVFMGTWCEDSHFIIPKFFALTDAAGFSQDRITLVGVDRQKKTLSHLSEALNVTNVPTIIVLKKGKEAGRVVEFGKYGVFDKELGEIIEAIDK
ncbi:MAG: thioredoxin family protein [Chitinophagaceae bacterium]